ncbi:hypothetical protein B296_00043440 [Ensete ventricosum]|uniref:Uncharacterized protein n=1 Tax=Ensete ventricosum TaxID=4639 RepID=A0A426YSG2_ENSVE|nr:hypothetical protein B296_00043440 [Ensete ventricosum]
MDLNVLHRKPRVLSGKNTLAFGVESSPPEVEEVRLETTTKRPAESPTPNQAATGRPGKRVKIVVRKHKSHHGEGSSRATAWEKEMKAPAEEDSSPSYRRLRSMKDLCHDASLVAESLVPGKSLGRGVLHLTLAKDLYTLPSEILIAQATKQIVLGHHYLMALLDKVHDAGRLVTIMGNRASLLEVEIDMLKTEGDPEYSRSGFSGTYDGWGRFRMSMGTESPWLVSRPDIPTWRSTATPFTEKPEDGSVPMETY